MGLSPYVPVFSKVRNIAAKEIGLLCAENCRLYCLPGVSAYIGSDIVAGVYVSGLAGEKSNVMFIDIGTNGEIVLKHGDKLISCSCAAGPALEGMNISAGVRAAGGAIEDIKFSRRSFELTTIDDERPIGICGSGPDAEAVRPLRAASRGERATIRIGTEPNARVLAESGLSASEAIAGTYEAHIQPS